MTVKANGGAGSRAGRIAKGRSMNLELTADELRILRKVLQSSLSELREEIVKTEKHEWRVALHHEESALKAVLDKLG